MTCIQGRDVVRMSLSTTTTTATSRIGSQKPRFQRFVAVTLCGFLRVFALLSHLPFSSPAAAAARAHAKAVARFSINSFRLPLG
jgi:hypothetical protein